MFKIFESCLTNLDKVIPKDTSHPRSLCSRSPRYDLGAHRAHGAQGAHLLSLWIFRESESFCESFGIQICDSVWWVPGPLITIRKYQGVRHPDTTTSHNFQWLSNDTGHLMSTSYFIWFQFMFNSFHTSVILTQHISWPLKSAQCRLWPSQMLSQDASGQAASQAFQKLQCPLSLLFSFLDASRSMSRSISQHNWDRPRMKCEFHFTWM